MWVKFIVGSRLAPRVFFGFSGFPLSTKTNISKFQFNQNRRPARKPSNVDKSSSLNIVNLFLIFIVTVKKHYIVVKRSRTHEFVSWER